jgi:polysaccharide biosynthesis protein PslH
MTARLLQICPITPARSGNGLAMRVSMFTEALTRIGPTEAVVVGGGVLALESPDDRLRLLHIPVAGGGDTMIKLIRAIAGPEERASGLRAYGRPSRAAALSAPVLRRIQAVIGAGDWSHIVINRAYLLPLLDAFPGFAGTARVLVDLDDDDAAYCREQAALRRSVGDAAEALWLEADADNYDRLIRRAAPRIATFTVSSQWVAAQIAARLAPSSAQVIVNGVFLPAVLPRQPDPASLLFVGNLGYHANSDGICWFLGSVWPLLRSALPQVRLTIAGANPTPRIRSATASATGVELCADVEDLTLLYRCATASIVPLRLGSGSRIKILEAGAHGVPVVSTRKGAEGLDIGASEIYMATDGDARAFAGACLRCLRDEKAALAKAERLGALVARRHNREQVIASISCLIRNAV